MDGEGPGEAIAKDCKGAIVCLGRSAVCLDNFDDDVANAGWNDVFRFGQTGRTNTDADNKADAVFTLDADPGAPRFVSDLCLELFFGSTCRSDVAHGSPGVWGEGRRRRSEAPNVRTGTWFVLHVRAVSTRNERAKRGRNGQSPVPIARTLYVSGGAAVS